MITSHYIMAALAASGQAEVHTGGRRNDGMMQAWSVPALLRQEAGQVKKADLKDNRRNWRWLPGYWP